METLLVKAVNANDKAEILAPNMYSGNDDVESFISICPTAPVQLPTSTVLTIEPLLSQKRFRIFQSFSL